MELNQASLMNHSRHKHKPFLRFLPFLTLFALFFLFIADGDPVPSGPVDPIEPTCGSSSITTLKVKFEDPASASGVPCPMYHGSICGNFTEDLSKDWVYFIQLKITGTCDDGTTWTRYVERKHMKFNPASCNEFTVDMPWQASFLPVHAVLTIISPCNGISGCPDCNSAVVPLIRHRYVDEENYSIGTNGGLLEFYNWDQVKLYGTTSNKCNCGK